MKNYFWIQSIIAFYLFYGSCLANHIGDSEKTQTLIITAASGELGSATAKLLARDYHLILTGCNNYAKL